MNVYPPEHFDQGVTDYVTSLLDKLHSENNIMQLHVWVVSLLITRIIYILKCTATQFCVYILLNSCIIDSFLSECRPLWQVSSGAVRTHETPRCATIKFIKLCGLFPKTKFVTKSSLQCSFCTCYAMNV